MGMHHPCFPPPPRPSRYPFVDNVHGECNCCVHMPPPPPPMPPHRAGGWMTENTFVVVNSTPYLYDNTRTKYGQFIRVSENVNTLIYQRPDPSCVNLSATLDMTESTTTNIVMNHYLLQTIENAYDVINGILPTLRSFVRFKLYYTIKDRTMGTVFESSVNVTTEDMKFHTTDIKDYFVTSFSNIFLGTIPILDTSDTCTLIIDRVEAYVDVIDVQSHISQGMNPYYQFIKNNTKIALQHDTITGQEPDESILLAVCEINKSFPFQPNVVTRIKMSFNAFLSSVIMTPNTFDVWNALYEPTDVRLKKLESDILNLQEENKILQDAVNKLTADNETMQKDIEELKKTVDGLVLKQQIQFSSYIEFPTIGEENKLYIAKDKGLSYLWDSATQTYVNMDKNNIDYDTIQSILGKEDSRS